MQSLEYATSAAVGFVFLLSALPKLRDRAGFVAAVGSYELLPARASVWVGRVLPWFELLLSAALISGFSSGPAGLLAAASLVAFASAVSVNLLRGRAIDCGCSGVTAPSSIGWAHVVRNLVLAGLVLVAPVGNTAVHTARSWSASLAPDGASAVALALLGSALVIVERLAGEALALRREHHGVALLAKAAQTTAPQRR